MWTDVFVLISTILRPAADVTKLGIHTTINDIYTRGMSDLVLNMEAV